MTTTTLMTARVRHAVAAALLWGVCGAAAAQSAPRIVAPDADDVVHSNAGTVNVVVADAPRGARLRPIVDGVAGGAVFDPPAFALSGLERGTHTLEITLLDPQGREFGRLGPVTFHLWQASRLFVPRQPG